MSSLRPGDLEPVIGLEVHIQLRTERKLFCGNRTDFGAPPNTRVCPVCLGLPGALPVLNREAVDLAVRVALAFGCEVHRTSVFARKSYFYPDLPKGYQISQFDRPLATGGRFPPDPRQEGEEGVRIRRIHLEEDAGKSLHDRWPGMTAVDLNRAGVPLVELVTEPDLGSPAATRAWLRELKRAVEYLDVSDCNMEEGSVRVDANVSLRPRGSARLGTKTEVKNLNSFSGIERALEAEIQRQTGLLERGTEVEGRTLLWDEARGEVRPMRSKEESQDYRYFPDPDLPPLELEAGWIRRVARGLPELPRARQARLEQRYGLSPYDADVLTASRAVADYFEAVAEAVDDPKEAANWVMGPVLALWKERDPGPGGAPAAAGTLAELIGEVISGRLSRSAAKDVLAELAGTQRSVAEIVAERGLAQVGDPDRLARWVDEALEEHPDEAARFLGGERRLQGWFVGIVMEKSGGSADPREVGRILASRP